MDELELRRRWVETWVKAGPELAEIRRREMVEADNRKSLRLLAGAFEHARSLPLRETSGLVEMQRLFGKLL